MIVIFEDKVVDFPETMIEALKTYALNMMELMRKSYPESAYCWNHCNILLDEYLSPSFCYGGSIEDVCLSDDRFTTSMLISHPRIITEKDCKKIRRK